MRGILLDHYKISKLIVPDELSECTLVLNKSFKTVADQFGLTRENSSTNNAFIDENRLQQRVEKGFEYFCLREQNTIIGCFAVEKSEKEENLFYLESIAVLPEYRHKGYGTQMVKSAIEMLNSRSECRITIALIDQHRILKDWYKKFGFVETGTRQFSHLLFRVCFMELNKSLYTDFRNRNKEINQV